MIVKRLRNLLPRSGAPFFITAFLNIVYIQTVITIYSKVPSRVQELTSSGLINERSSNKNRNVLLILISYSFCTY
jgi:hypothetical protein